MASNLSSFDKEERREKIANINFQQAALNPPAGPEKLHDDLVPTGVAATYQRLRWGLIFSVVLVACLALPIWAIFALNARAINSQADLIHGYQLSWKIGMAAASAKVFLMITLLVYGTFEFTVLLFGSFSPEPLVVIVLGGLFR